MSWRYWKVRTRIYFKDGKWQDQRVLLEAGDADDAMTLGIQYAGDHAPFGAAIHSFEAMEAESVQLPMVLG